MMVTLLIIIALVLIIVALNSRKDKSVRKHWLEESRATSPATPRRITITTWHGERSGKAGVKPEWRGQGESVVIGRITITNPMTYVNDSSPEFDEASCIDLTLPIGQPVDEPKGALGYWPTYQRMTPNQRATYVRWLADGKKNPLADIGYVFVYYYGLERRALLDGRDEQSILSEILRLRGIYSSSNSFLSYSASLLAYLAAKRLPQGLDEALVTELGKQALQGWETDLNSVILAYFYHQARPLSAAWAQRIASWDPHAQRSVVTERLPEQLATLFAEKYQQRKLDTQLLQVGMTSRKIECRCASATIRSGYKPFEPPPVEIVDVLGCSTQFTELVDTWNECIEELKPLSRKIALGHDLDSREAFEALPPELRRTIDHPDAPRWKEVIVPCTGDDGVALVEVSKIAPLLNILERDRLTLKQTKDLVETAQHIGYVVEPDGKILNTNYDWDALLSMFHDDDAISKPTEPRYIAASLVLQLGLWVASADGHTEVEELHILTQFIADLFDLAPHESRRLEIQKKALLLRPIEPGRLGKRLQEALSTEQRAKLGELLVAIAAATKGIDESEWRALRKAYRDLNVPAEELDKVVATLLPTRDELVVVRPGKAKTAGEPIPRRTPTETPQTVKLDENKLREILESTREVTVVLASVFADDAARDSTQVTQTTVAAPQSNQYLGLDPRYHVVLTSMLTKECWPSSEFSALIEKCGLRTIDVVEKVNTWSDEQLGDFLVTEEGDIVRVQLSLIGNQS